MSDSKDQLFLLKPSFADPAEGPGPFYCGQCAALEGVLGYYPALRSGLEVVHVDFHRPRKPLDALLGADYQSCPVLVLALGASDERIHGAEVTTSPVTGRPFVQGANRIMEYLARAHAAARLHP